MNEIGANRSNEQADLPDHADAFASILENYAQLVRAGYSVGDLALQLIPIMRVAARRT
jgi:hypothetical protein